MCLCKKKFLNLGLWSIKLQKPLNWLDLVFCRWKNWAKVRKRLCSGATGSGADQAVPRCWDTACASPQAAFQGPHVSPSSNLSRQQPCIVSAVPRPEWEGPSASWGGVMGVPRQSRPRPPSSAVPSLPPFPLRPPLWEQSIIRSLHTPPTCLHSGHCAAASPSLLAILGPLSPKACPRPVHAEVTPSPLRDLAKAPVSPALPPDWGSFLHIYTLLDKNSYQY